MNWEHTSTTGAGELTCRPLVAERFEDVLAVFGERGVASKCCCIYWRRPDGRIEDEAANRQQLLELTLAGPPPGLVGYIGDEPVGWVSLGARDDFPALNRSNTLRPIDETPVWSVNCFVTRVGYRRQGIADAMLAGAIEYARSCNASVLEAYPWDGSTKSAVNLYTGTLGMFSEWAEVTRRRPHRPIVRLEL